MVPTQYVITSYHRYWGFKLYVTALYDTPSTAPWNRITEISNNSAMMGSGGGLYIFENCPYPLFFNVLVSNNRAKDGGGFYFETLVTGGFIHSFIHSFTYSYV
jgi:predicted outer membrane repeat protein